MLFSPSSLLVIAGLICGSVAWDVTLFFEIPKLVVYSYERFGFPNSFWLRTFNRGLKLTTVRFYVFLICIDDLMFLELSIYGSSLSIEPSRAVSGDSLHTAEVGVSFLCSSDRAIALRSKLALEISPWFCSWSTEQFSSMHDFVSKLLI